MSDLKRFTRMKAIKAFCYDCLGHQRLARTCTDHECPLYPYRLGKEETDAWPAIITKFREAGYFRKSEAAKKAAHKRNLSCSTTSKNISKERGGHNQ